MKREEQLVALIYKHFHDPRSARLVYESVKDGIGIDYPTHALVEFVAALSALQAEAGMVSVPRIVNDEMREVVERWAMTRPRIYVQELWNAMLSAAPAHAAQVAHGDALEPRK